MAKKGEKRYGTCQNPECMNYGISDVIPDDGKCPVCQQPMKPEEESIDGNDINIDDMDDISSDVGSNKKKAGKGKIIAIICGVLAAAGLGVGAFFLFGGEKTPDEIVLNQKNLDLNVGDTVRLVPTVKPEGAKATFVFKKNNMNIKVSKTGLITALAEGESKVEVTCLENKKVKAICKITVKQALPKDTPTVVLPPRVDTIKIVDTIMVKEKVKQTPQDKEPSSGTRTIKLGYGTYTGDANGSKPNGFGDVVFTHHKYINSSYSAEPGYKIRNARFVNGKLQSGTLYDEDGIKVGFIDANNNL